MYNNLQKNPFERETDLLQQPQIREQVMMIYLASVSIAKSNWKQALEHIAKYRQMVRQSRLLKQQALQLQLQFMQTFCAFKMDNLSKAEQMIQNLLDCIVCNVGDRSYDRSLNKSMSRDNSRNKSLANITQRQFSYKAFAVKCYTLAANIIITQQQKTELDFKQIKRGLLQLLEPLEMKQFIPEVLGTLTGCKYFKPLIDMQMSQIFLKQNSHKSAKKMQILADWKYLAGCIQNAVDFKQKAVELWQELNSHKELTQCRKQLQELTATSSKSSYKLRLARIKVFAQPIIKLQQPIDHQNRNKVGVSLIRFYLPIILDQLQNQKEQKPKQKQSVLTQSKVKKQNLLDRISQQCELFYQVYKKQKEGQTTNLLLNSKFVDENFKNIRKCMSIFLKLRSLRLRDVFNLLKRVQLKNTKLIKEAIISKFKASDMI